MATKNRNLEQMRAMHALEWSKKIGAGAKGGDPTGVVKKIPAQVITCGLLASMAFAGEKKEGYADVFKAFLDYCPALKSTSIADGIKEISGLESDELRYITAEFMSYLGYLRRFVEKQPQKED